MRQCTARSARSAAWRAPSKGNLVTEDDQWRKRGRLVEVAPTVWGDVQG